jgi:hypothetical protein
MKKSIVAASAMLLATLSFGALAEDAKVNCDTAQQDIAALEGEKNSSLEQMEKGVTSIMPSTAVLHMMTGTEKESQAIASGEYNKRIDDHIALIKSACGIQ